MKQFVDMSPIESNFYRIQKIKLDSLYSPVQIVINYKYDMRERNVTTYGGSIPYLQAVRVLLRQLSCLCACIYTAYTLSQTVPHLHKTFFSRSAPQLRHV